MKYKFQRTYEHIFVYLVTFTFDPLDGLFNHLLYSVFADMFVE